MRREQEGEGEGSSLSSDIASDKCLKGDTMMIERSYYEMYLCRVPNSKYGAARLECCSIWSYFSTEIVMKILQTSVMLLSLFDCFYISFWNKNMI